MTPTTLKINHVSLATITYMYQMGIQHIQQEYPAHGNRRQTLMSTDQQPVFSIYEKSRVAALILKSIRKTDNLVFQRLIQIRRSCTRMNWDRQYLPNPTGLMWSMGMKTLKWSKMIYTVNDIIVMLQFHMVAKHWLGILTHCCGHCCTDWFI